MNLFENILRIWYKLFQYLCYMPRAPPFDFELINVSETLISADSYIRLKMFTVAKESFVNFELTYLIWNILNRDITTSIIWDLNLITLFRVVLDIFLKLRHINSWSSSSWLSGSWWPPIVNHSKIAPHEAPC